MKTFLSCCLLATLVAGCPIGDGQEVIVGGDIVVPVGVQRLFSTGRRGAVLVDADYTGIPGEWGPMVVGILCEPETNDLVVPFEYEKIFGCAQEIQIKAWVEAVSKDAMPLPPCGPGTLGTGVGDRTMVFARGEELANQGQTKCVSGTARARVRLSLVP